VDEKPSRPALWDPSPRTTADGSPTLFSPRYGETFRSQRGAQSEADHVFVIASGIAERLAAREATRVLEVGLGPATNFLRGAALALEQGSSYHHHAIELEPLPAEAWVLAGIEHFAPEPLVQALIEARRAADLTPNSFWSWQHQSVRLSIEVRNVATLSETPLALEGLFHAIYHDPFSPDVNPEAWTPEVLGALAALLAPGAALVSYSVQGSVRRALAAAGLEVHKHPGPKGGKREVLLARRPSGTAP
jgi:tRNA 5-methylaminomethyl-2-thiouridine biosynthesis bifunctional protein